MFGADFPCTWEQVVCVCSFVLFWNERVEIPPDFVEGTSEANGRASDNRVIVGAFAGEAGRVEK